MEKEKSQKEKARESIDHFLNDFYGYPDVWLSDEEKIDYGEKAKADPKSDFAKRVFQWSHNKHSVTWWIAPALLKVEEIIFFEDLIRDEGKREILIKNWESLHELARSEQKDKISAETVKKIENLLREAKKAL